MSFFRRSRVTIVPGRWLRLAATLSVGGVLACSCLLSPPGSPSAAGFSLSVFLLIRFRFGRVRAERAETTSNAPDWLVLHRDPAVYRVLVVPSSGTIVSAGRRAHTHTQLQASLFCARCAGQGEKFVRDKGRDAERFLYHDTAHREQPRQETNTSRFIDSLRAAC